jgi:hypothetical protein
MAASPAEFAHFALQLGDPLPIPGRDAGPRSSCGVSDLLDGDPRAGHQRHDEQLADYRPWFDNHNRLRELIAELEALSLAIAENDPRWNR